LRSFLTMYAKWLEKHSLWSTMIPKSVISNAICTETNCKLSLWPGLLLPICNTEHFLKEILSCHSLAHSLSLLSPLWSTLLISWIAVYILTSSAYNFTFKSLLNRSTISLTDKNYFVTKTGHYSKYRTKQYAHAQTHLHTH